MTAASAMNPRPADMFIWNDPADARLSDEPAMPAMMPARIIAR
jgi:hypothetical protein